MSNWKPTGYPSMSPYLTVMDPEALIEFLQKVFGGVLLQRFDRPDGSLMHAEVRIDDSVVMIGGAISEDQTTRAYIHLYSPDVTAAFQSAVAAGATVVRQPERKDEHDDLRGGVQDASGTTWWIATQ